MGKLSKEISALVTESRGLDIAKKESIEWYKKTASSSGDSSVENYNGPFKPGKIYIFRYENPKTKDTLEWWDRNPVVLSLGQHDGKDIGINLNLIPYARKIQLLDKIYDQYESRIDTMVKRGRGDASSEQGIPSFTYERVKPFLEKTGFGAAVRTYIIGLRKNSRVVSYFKWNRVALIDLNDIKGATINKAYSKIGKYIKKHKK